jgi:quercetin dioxygenase-like cupin family protein
LPLLNPASVKASLEEMKARRGPAPWNEILVRNDRITVTVICQPPGHQNDHHYHLQDEWWIIAEGELCWELEGQPEPIYVKAGDFVFAPANSYHLIHVLGTTQAIRIGVSYTGEGHRHNRQDPPEPPVRGAGNVLRDGRSSCAQDERPKTNAGAHFRRSSSVLRLHRSWSSVPTDDHAGR